VQIKTGISDGVVTEVIEGLKEGDRVVTGELASTSGAASPAANPFSGGARRFP
jgi:HlyD family secretion protein